MVAKIHDFENSDLPEHIKLALRFTESWVLHHAQTIDDELIDQLKEYFTEQQIVELAFWVMYVEGMHKFNAAFDIAVPPEGMYQIHTTPVPAETKQDLKSFGFSVVSRGISFDAHRPAKCKALFVAEGEDIVAELAARVDASRK